MTTTTRIDSKGRVSIPRKVRDLAGFQTGDVLFVAIDSDTETLQLRKVTNPFDGLALDAIAEYERGDTRSLREIAEDEGIDLDDRRQN